MCGIFGIISNNNIKNDLLEGLKKLEYRGYDSAGVAIMNNSDISICKSSGEIKNLQSKIKKEKLTDGNIGIAHTRWATHGKNSLKNTHPHMYKDIAIVHNGIIENYSTIKNEMIKLGHKFISDTDSEVIPHLIDAFMMQGESIITAIRKTVKKLQGSFAIAVIYKKIPNQIIVIKKYSALLIGKNNNNYYISSDLNAINDDTKEIMYLKDDDIGIINSQSVKIIDSNYNLLKRDWIKLSLEKKEKNYNLKYKDNTLKEIYDQKHLLENFQYTNTSINHSNYSNIHIIACGSSYYASELVSKLFRKNDNKNNINVNVHIASEFAYYPININHNDLLIFVSQSGETADTISAIRHSNKYCKNLIAVTNNIHSSIANLCNISVNINCQKEIGVAATKSFTLQVMSLLSLLKYDIKNIDINCILKQYDDIDNIAKELSQEQYIMFLGRGIELSIANEIALKMKELSYIVSDSYASGELKHGPIALIQKDIPVIMFTPYNNVFDKNISTAEELIARGAKLYFITDKKGKENCNIKCHRIFSLDHENDLSVIFLQIIFGQLLSYCTAKHKGCNIDKPKNLAKSVTVE